MVKQKLGDALRQKIWDNKTYTNVSYYADYAKKAILEAPVYLLGDEENDEGEFWAVYEIVIKWRKHPHKH